MPKIQFSDLPRGVWHHLLQRVDERGISVNDLLLLQTWVRTSPLASEGDWYKDFGSFVLCGSGEFPKTVLEKGMKPFGEDIVFENRGSSLESLLSVLTLTNYHQIRAPRRQQKKYSHLY